MFVKYLLQYRITNFFIHILAWLIFVRPLRTLMVYITCAYIKRRLIKHRHLPIERQRDLLFLSIIKTVDRSIRKGIISKRVAYIVPFLWTRAFSLKSNQRPRVQRFRKIYGCDPPWFITIGPGHSCNLHCTGCYANSDSSDEKLDWSVLDRIITEAKELWDIRVVVFSGGEPLLYRSEGKDLLDMVEKHSDLLFLMFTNGTKVTEEIASRMKRLGNLTAALSVEGMHDRTDTRRGHGIFNQVLTAMARLRKSGVPFGISVTVTRDNVEEALSDEFLRFFFEEQGAFYGFFFQYMPIDYKPDLSKMPAPIQRMEFWERTWQAIERKNLFLIDFWNHGPLVGGCIAAGRDGGYVYIDWNGKVMPCVFAPFSAVNIHHIYERNGNLNDIWDTPYLRAIREWQRSYRFSNGYISNEGNLLCACPFRDHHAVFRRWIHRYQPEPQYGSDHCQHLSDEYYRFFVEYGEELKKLCQPIWERAYINAAALERSKSPNKKR